MRNGIYLISVHDGRAYRGLVDAVPYHFLPEAAVLQLNEFIFITMAGDIDIFRAEFHEGSNALQKFILCYAAQRWDYFQRGVWLGRSLYYFADFHLVKNSLN